MANKTVTYIVWSEGYGGREEPQESTMETKVTVSSEEDDMDEFYKPFLVATYKVLWDRAHVSCEREDVLENPPEAD